MDLSDAAVSIRLPDGSVLEDEPWSAASVSRLQTAAPWRPFRWYQGQKHYSGTYWSSTMRDHVVYESRLELARLLYADFDHLVWHIVAQPFLLKAVVDGEIRRHVPDFLLLTTSGPVIVDVKPQSRRELPAVVATSGWTRELADAHGWSYELPWRTLLHGVRPHHILAAPRPSRPEAALVREGTPPTTGGCGRPGKSRIGPSPGRAR
ncbi:TnsA-like heteromeric transposase endonuclease subunit [Streptomyces sp. SCSIO 30461]|uniref:TnsA-like heteromeric transposase endonuclease subunit n=1 Tax=Streptomyces sp. SCSIO 30461 TaxID=3118085 RepID=UPI0030CDE8F7